MLSKKFAEKKMKKKNENPTAIYFKMAFKTAGTKKRTKIKIELCEQFSNVIDET